LSVRTPQETKKRKWQMRKMKVMRKMRMRRVKRILDATQL
jgi:hypothetical protein